MCKPLLLRERIKSKLDVYVLFSKNKIYVHNYHHHKHSIELKIKNIGLENFFFLFIYKKNIDKFPLNNLKHR